MMDGNVTIDKLVTAIKEHLEKESKKTDLANIDIFPETDSGKTYATISGDVDLTALAEAIKNFDYEIPSYETNNIFPFPDFKLAKNKKACFIANIDLKAFNAAFVSRQDKIRVNGEIYEVLVVLRAKIADGHIGSNTTNIINNRFVDVVLEKLPKTETKKRNRKP